MMLQSQWCTCDFMALLAYQETLRLFSCLLSTCCNCSYSAVLSSIECLTHCTATLLLKALKTDAKVNDLR